MGRLGNSKMTPEEILFWIVLGLGTLFVTAIDAPTLLLGLIAGFACGVFAVWRNPWGMFYFARPDLEDPAKPSPPGQGAPTASKGGQQVTVNLMGDNVPVVKQPCAHCGAMVDIVQYSTCPKCGASLK